jgi:membrane protein
MAQVGRGTGWGPIVYPPMADTAPRSPADLSPRSWKQIALDTWREAGKDNVEIVAAGVAFYAFSALVPLLTAFVLSYGLVAEPASVVSHMQTLTSVMPQNAAEIIGDQLRSMTEGSGGKTGFALLLALLVALYGASKGASSLMTAMNIAWGVKETRGFVRRTLIGLAMTAGAVLVMLLGIFSASAMGFIEELLPALGGAVHILIQALSFAIAAAAVVLLLAVVYRYAPNRPDAKWAWITPGSILATAVWLLATVGFGFYVSNFGSYNATYGSLGAIIVFLTWLYITAYIVLLGAELNAVLEEKAAASGADPAAEADSTRPATAAPAAGPQPASPGKLAVRFGAASLALALLGRSRRRAA